MKFLNLGLTTTDNFFHDPELDEIRFTKLIVKSGGKGSGADMLLWHASQAYGLCTLRWIGLYFETDLDPKYGFHELDFCQSMTEHDSRCPIRQGGWTCQRLLELNFRRHAEEAGSSKR
jgi:hypothetical protein